MKIEQALSILGVQPGLCCSDDIVQAIRADERDRFARSMQRKAVEIEVTIRADERERVAQFVEQAVFEGYRPYSIEDCEGIAAFIRGLP